jgi:hypothetical protein
MSLPHEAAIPSDIAVCGHFTQNTAQPEPKEHRKGAKNAKANLFAFFASSRCKITLIAAFRE